VSRAHRVDPSRATQHDNVAAYRAGQLAGRASRTGGGKPPRAGCALTLLMLPWLLLRHRAGEQPDRHDPRPDRLGAHETTGFSDHLTPAAELLRRLNHPTTKEK
jgi:hypothetical protein